MSQKKEYAKKLLDIITGWKDVDGLDEILHPEYYEEQHLTAKDRLWMNSSSWNRILTEKKSNSYKDFNADGKGFHPQSGIESAKIRLSRSEDEKSLSPKPKYSIHNIVEDGDQVIVTFIASFVHDLPYYGINPTNHKVEMNCVYIITFLEDKIVKIVGLFDTHQLLVKMGDVILRNGDEEQIQQYMGMLKRQNLIP
ncbi:MAG: hypothetical protein ACXAC2_09345 [Candidatus Kariarchaeaceae archaeon]|jgi:predicted ester cyclase